MKFKSLVVVCLLLVALVATGCAPAKAPSSKAEVPAEYRSLRLVGSSTGSETTTTVLAYAALLTKHYPEIEWSSVSGATGTNPVYITKGTIKAAMVLPSNYIDAYGYDKIPESRLRSLALPRALVEYFFVIPEDKPWKDITEVPKGVTLSPGSPGTTVPITAETWLRVVGLSKKDFNWIPLGKSELADAWRAGKLDVGMITVSGSAPFLLDMYTSPRKFKPIGLTPDQVAKANAEQAFQRIGFEAPTLGQVSKIVPEIFKYDVVSPQQPNFLCVRDDFPDDIAYRMAKIFDEKRADLLQIYPSTKWGATPQWHIQWAKPPFAIHPGVAKYYKEKGYLK